MNACGQYEVTIIIPHFESENLLKFCVEQILKYEHPQIEQQIIIVNDGMPYSKLRRIKNELQNLQSLIDNFFNPIMLTNTLRSDKSQNAGYPLDFAVSLLSPSCDYVVSLDCDAFPISPDWIFDGIKDIESGKADIVGRNSCFAKPYFELLKDENEKWHARNFKIIDNCFRIMSSDLFRKLSSMIGFKAHIYNVLPWGHADYTPIVGYSDSGVAAMYYATRVLMQKVKSYAVLKHVGKIDKHGSFGQVIGDVDTGKEYVWHLSLGTRFLSESRKDLFFSDEDKKRDNEIGRFIEIAEEIKKEGLNEDRFAELRQMEKIREIKELNEENSRYF